MSNRRTSMKVLASEQMLIDKKLKELRNANNTLRQQQSNDMRDKMWEGLKWGFKGFGNIAKSMSQPNSNKRMKIAQMPAKRSDMDIIRHADTNMLKHAQMRQRDIRGRKIR